MGLKSIAKKIIPKNLYNRVRYFKWKWYDVKRDAKEFLQIVREKKGQNTALIVIGYCLGDAVYAMSLLKAYKEANPKKKVVVLGTMNNEELLKSYKGYDELYLMNLDDRDFRYVAGILNATSISEKALKDDIIAAVPASNKVCIRDSNPETLHQLCTHFYKIGTSTLPILPSLPRDEVKSIADFDKICDRTVILNPYSNAVKRNKRLKGIFCMIANMFLKRGFRVYTNAVGTQEPVEGTEKLDCSLKELSAICEKIPLIVSVRSGVLDYLIDTGVNMFAMYPEKAEIKQKYFTLKGWHGKGKICEVSLKNRPQYIAEACVEFYKSL